MKTLKNLVATLDGTKMTIVADVVDEPFNEWLVSRVTHGYINPENQDHPRHVQSSNAAVFVRHCNNGFFIRNDDLVKIATLAEPCTSFPPKLKDGSVPPKLEFYSETPIKYQWQVSDNPLPMATAPHTPPPPAVWTDISGQVGDTLDESTVEVGKWVRCVATNMSGSTISQPVKKA